jgi:hypothetical protein
LILRVTGTQLRLRRGQSLIAFQFIDAQVVRLFPVVGHLPPLRASRLGIPSG